MCAFLVSPGVEVKEIDLTNIIPAVSTSIGGFAGYFRWGPVEQIKLLSSEKGILDTFGEPDALTAESFFTAASFLKYGTALKVVRASDESGGTILLNSVAGSGLTQTAALIKNEDHFETLAGLSGDIFARYPGVLGNSLEVQIIDSANWATAPNASLFDSAPTGDEVHVVVLDEDGGFASAGTILETWAYLQTTDGAKLDNGANNYWKDVINRDSNWIHLNTDDCDAGEYSLSDGVDIDAAGIAEAGNITTALDLFDDVENVDISLLFTIADAAASNIISNYAHGIAYSRKDCVAFISPPIVASTGNDPLTDVLAWGAGITVRDADGSYGVADTSAVYVYDKYRDKFLWIGSAGITAGLCANTDDVSEPWFSPAGFNRGSIKGVTKAAYLPKQADRDELYKFGLNFFLSQPGTGLVLYGDKTLQAKPSAFDRINVRRLFIVLEKAIATAAKFQLFELNDEFTRAIFKNMVEPFLRDVKGRRGVTDFHVVCDDTNNTGQVIDTNRFVADIYIKPARSINFITLNFIATRTGVQFSEIIGLTQ